MGLSEEDLQRTYEDLGKLEEAMFAFAQRLEEGSEKGTLPVHAPHGVLTFAHKYYHGAFLTARDEEAHAIFDAAAARGIPTEDAEIDLDDIQHDILWKMFAGLIMFGAELANTGQFELLQRCCCGKVDDLDAKLEAFFNEQHD